MIRKARISDVKKIQNLISDWAAQGVILPRSLSEIYDNLRDFFIFYQDGIEDNIIGCCAMHICWENLAEIRSLVVKEGFERKGIGRKLVDACLSEALLLGIYRIFVLTYRPEFFEKLGFNRTDKNVLPHKIWSDCIKCFKFPDCDEVSLILEL